MTGGSNNSNNNNNSAEKNEVDEVIIVSIKDTGIGIDSEVFPRLFAKLA